MLIWNWFYSFVDALVMFDIIKIYPIWLPPCYGDAWDMIVQSLKRLGKAANKALQSCSDVSKALIKFQEIAKGREINARD